jgi:methyl-accepting chemotaxis protein
MSGDGGRGRLRTGGLAVRLVGATLLVFAAATAALTYAATTKLEHDLGQAFQSKGAAIALAIAAAAERSAKGDPLIVQNAIEANRSLDGVAYILVLDQADQMYGSTFVAGMPGQLVGKNHVMPGTPLERGVTVLPEPLAYVDEGGSARRAFDVAAPIERGALGTVRIGMDKDVVDKQVHNLRTSMLLTGLVVALGAIAVFLLFAVVTVLRPVAELTRVTSEIVQRGDLTQHIRVHRDDEIGQLAHTFSLMVDKLREIPRRILESTQILKTSVGKLGESVVEQGQTATLQAAALQETQVTAQEIRQTSLVAAGKAEAVLQYAARAESVSRTGEAAVEQSLAALTAIRSQVEEIAQRITKLGEQAIQIGNVTQTVKDIADQSNMLALNAAIEAVRSGEHGRGFAVVAREMRSLADQSIQGTNQVREMLEHISAAIREAVAITDKGVQRIDTGLAQVKTSGQTFSELSGIVRDNSSAVRQISAAVGQQNAGIAQIFGAVNAQTKMMTETIARLEATDTSLSALKDASERLVLLVEQFKV